ncbi:tyrosine-protein phosphatase [Breznakiella homolactica]|uniref:SAM-dependent chlorinase/fluorinase n=1 Tax=Breznakiella homolactica TaxID=2798577 RepID=A0A7T7XRI6_9SPIR|nr:tyrosine-protein phosphatase [Breznakiella homolactica]QQO11109.1 SAM-dependent chlorinase/fluorinase [Breznakiella homolactica]
MRLTAAGFLLVSLLISCASSAAPKTADASAFPKLQGSAATVDKYGNVTTDIAEADLISAGYELGDVLRVTAGNAAENAPLVSTYSDVNRGEVLVRVSDGFVAVAISYGNFGEKAGIQAGSPISLEMAEKGGYTTEYALRHLEKSENRSDYESDAVFANFREVRLGKIAPHTLYRSCHPALGDARAPYAASLAEQAGIRTIINLADSQEEVFQKAATSSWYKSMLDSESVVYLNMGVDFESPDFAPKLREGLKFMISHDGPYLVHCNEGKDRAGIVSALLEALMGASVREIADDYMVTYYNYFGVEKGEPRYDLISQIIIDIFKEMNDGKAVRDSNIQKVAENYLTKTVGLSSQEVAALKAKLSGK